MAGRIRDRALALLSSAAVIVLLVAFASQPAVAQSYRITQLTPLGGSTPFVSYFEPAAINDFGQVLFAPDLYTGGEGVFLWQRGQLTAIAKGGQTMPDGGTMGYTLGPLGMNEWGEVAFTMTRNEFVEPPPAGLNAGVYRYNPRTGVVPVMVPGLKGHGDNMFLGSTFIPAINNWGEIVFPAMVCSTANNSVPSEPCPNGGAGVLALGVYKADEFGRILPVVKPGDPVPGGPGHTFDLAHGVGLNDRGDVGFAAHVYGEECGAAGTLFCADSLYVKRAATGKIESIAHHGSPSPVSGKNYFSAYGPVVNNAGDIAYLGDLSTLGDGSDVAVFLYTHGKSIVIAKSGDAMPGGGVLKTGGFYPHTAFLNDAGDIAFDGTLANGDNALYVWHRATLKLVAKTGMNIGVGTIATLDDSFGGVANTQIAMNNWGQVLFMARFQEGGAALLLATPK